MKKRLRKTGEIVDVINYSAPNVERDKGDYVSYIDSKGVEYNAVHGLNIQWDFEDVEEELTKEIDWEQVRIDAAIAALNGFCSNYHMARISDVSLSISSVGAADALIAELKKGGKDENYKR